MKKNPNTISDEELLKLLDTSDDEEVEEVLKFDSTVLTFVQSFDLKPGKDKIKKQLLYKLYRMWNKGRDKLSQRSFTDELNNYIDHQNHFYLIDKSFFNIAQFVEDEKKKRRFDKSKSKAWHQHFESFLSDTGLDSGSTYIELEILYFLYLQWRNHARKTALISRTQFIKILDLYFEVKAISAGNHLWVGVNEQVKNLISKKEVERWRKIRGKNKRFFYPQEEWRQFALYWEEKDK